MAILILLAALVLLGVLANRYGYDSRDRLHTKDEDLVAAGIRWEPNVADRAPRVAAVAPARTRRDAELAEAA